MTLNEYQEKAMTTCMPSCDNFIYMMLNLVGEVGEFSSKIAKAIRKEQGIMDGENFVFYKFQEEGGPTARELKAELMKEAGDILWQLAGLCRIMGWELEDVARGNLNKLASRAERGVIDGNGDNR